MKRETVEAADIVVVVVKSRLGFRKPLVSV